MPRSLKVILSLSVLLNLVLGIALGLRMYDQYQDSKLAYVDTLGAMWAANNALKELDVAETSREKTLSLMTANELLLRSIGFVDRARYILDRRGIRGDRLVSRLQQIQDGVANNLYSAVAEKPPSVPLTSARGKLGELTQAFPRDLPSREQARAINAVLES